MKLDKKQIQKIAELARLDLSDQEALNYSKELTAILEYAEDLQKIDTEELVETCQVTGLKNIMRDDKVEQPQTSQEILNNSPLTKDGFIQVKNIFEK